MFLKKSSINAKKMEKTLKKFEKSPISCDLNQCSGILNIFCNEMRLINPRLFSGRERAGRP